MDSVTTFSEKHGISKTRVQQLIDGGKLIAKKNGHNWVILGEQALPKKRRIQQRGKEGDVIASFKTIEDCWL